MDERRMKGLMGLCVRAGQAVFGDDALGLRLVLDQKSNLHPFSPRSASWQTDQRELPQKLGGESA